MGERVAVAAGAGNAFGLEGFEDGAARGAEFKRVKAHHEKVEAVARDFGRTFLRMEAGNFGETRGEALAVLVARIGLFFEAIELGVEDGALKFGEAIIAGDAMVFVPDAAFDSAATVNAATGGGEFVVVGGDEAAFAGREIFAGLK